MANQGSWMDYVNEFGFGFLKSLMRFDHTGALRLGLTVQEQ